ncbi:MAG: TIGR04282 family arsenosugar biosynthesis glycosyltransferase [Magnetovibrionaceae bacterium]
MRAGRTLVLFAKVPKLGRVKTRLARETSAPFATRFARRGMEQVIRRTLDDPRWRTVLSVSPDKDRGVHIPCWPPGPVRCGQGGGDLGDRMARALRTLGRGGPVVIVGCDIPGVSPRTIWQAFEALKANDAVFGPAGDGGYWCIGWAGRRPLPPTALTGVRWGGPQALEGSIKSLPQSCRIALIEILEDVDTARDYARITQSLTPPWPVNPPGP